MADEEVVAVVAPSVAAAGPAPSDHKRKLDDLESPAAEEPPMGLNAYSDEPAAVEDAKGSSEPADDDAASEAKRPRLEDKQGGSEASENGYKIEVAVNEEALNKEAVNEEALNKEAVNEEALNMEALNEEAVSEGVLKGGAVNEEVVNEEVVNGEAVNKEVVNGEAVNEEAVNGDAVSKEAGEHPSADSTQLEPAEDLSVEAPQINKNEQSATDNETAGVQNLCDENPQPTSVDDIPSEEQKEYPSEFLEHVSSELLPQPPSSDIQTTRQMEVPNNKVGVLIGKSGDTIRFLQYNSGAKIQITRDSDADPHSTARPVELIGTLENIIKAEKLIKDVIAEADAGGSPALVARGFAATQSTGAGEQILIQVPNEKVGLIIGKGGETIKNLQTRSGARIQLIPQHLPEGDQSRERTVRVTGDRRQIENAREMIKEVMNQI